MVQGAGKKQIQEAILDHHSCQGITLALGTGPCITLLEKAILHLACVQVANKRAAITPTSAHLLAICKMATTTSMLVILLAKKARVKKT